jgi:hypothetical protein
MGMVAFFPWFTIAAPKTFGRFKILPHTIGVPSPHGIPFELDLVFGRYRRAQSQPVERMCVVQMDGKPVDADLSEPEREDLFTFAECLATSALAAREFFTHRYTNRDTFTLILQSFNSATDPGVLITARRRDGEDGLYWPKNFVSFSPPHVHPEGAPPIDDSLVTALMAARELPGWSRFDSPIYFFNRSNTDSDLVSLHSEVVHSIGAFEHLLSVTSGDVDDLATAVTDRLSRIPEDNALPLSLRLTREHTLKKYPSVRHFWARDMYNTRNSFAHGSKVRTRSAETWSAREHLLVAAHVFPLCLKVELAAKGVYTMTEEDDGSIFALDRLLRLENLFGMIPIDPPDDSTLPMMTGSTIRTIRATTPGASLSAKRGSTGTVTKS